MLDRSCKGISVDFRGAFEGVRCRETDEARDKAGLDGTDVVADARTVDERRRGSGAAGGTSDQPKRAARMAVSEGGVARVCCAGVLADASEFSTSILEEVSIV